MNVVAVARVKNEADIIEEFVRHTLGFVDALVVVDNMSFDQTPDILRALKQEGLPLTILEDDTLPYRQSALMTRYVRQVFAETDAEYIALLDADEFLKARSRSHFQSGLSALKDGTHGLLPWKTYIPTPDTDLDEPRVLARIRHRLTTEAKQYYKIVVARAFVESPTSTIAQGNHAIIDGERAAETVLVDGVSLAHFPVRSIPQIQSKALLCWSAMLAMDPTGTTGFSYQWRRIFEKLTANPHWSADDLYQSAVHYLDDETESAPQLKYDPLPVPSCTYANAQPDLLSVAIGYVRQLATLYGRLSHEYDRLSTKADPP